MKTALYVLAAVLGGVAVSFLNYLVLLSAVKSGDDKRTLAVSPLRSVLSAAYLFLLFFISVKVKVSAFYLLIGGAVGLTASLALFTKLLLNKENRSPEKEILPKQTEKENSNEREC